MTLVSFDDFCSQILHHTLVVTNDHLCIHMHADHVLVGGEIEDTKLNTSFTIEITDKIYEHYEEGERWYLVTDEGGEEIFGIYIK